ncbi:MFS transporter [Sphingomonas segetis]|uniref:MFS transporter n=1 Tax=Sphingomonas segetis TaxID=1104779 RepID=UPI0012D34181|nr:nitrate/nitrite transporter [Sphingomonas segetis]
MVEHPGVSEGQRRWALAASTVAFTACFAVWTIFSIIGIKIQKDLGLSDTEFGLLVGTPILTGSISRLFIGILADRFGGRIVMSLIMAIAAAAAFGLSYAHTYPQFLAAALVMGLAGGSFAAGVAYVARWFPKERTGTALGIFGMGTFGSAITNFSSFVMVALGWVTVARIWAVALAAVAIAFYLFTRDDPIAASQRRGAARIPLATQLESLKKLQVWRFAIYYAFVFGAFVALALWLPRYYIGAYGLSVATAGFLATAYSLPGSVFRAVGGWLSDKFGARNIMYATFGVSMITTFLLSYPTTRYVVQGIDGPIEFTLAMGVAPFAVLTFVLGLFMSFGMAAVYKHIPVYYPDNVGSVGGLVGMIGGLGGFALPIAFGAMADLTGVWTSCFMLLFLLVSGAMLWMHLAVRRMERRRVPQLRNLPQLPEMEGLGAGPPPAHAPAGIATQAIRPHLYAGVVAAE